MFTKAIIERQPIIFLFLHIHYNKHKTGGI